MKEEELSKSKFVKKNLKARALQVSDTEESSNTSESKHEFVANSLKRAASSNDKQNDAPKPKNIGKRGKLSKTGF